MPRTGSSRRCPCMIAACRVPWSGDRICTVDLLGDTKIMIIMLSIKVCLCLVNLFFLRRWFNNIIWSHQYSEVWLNTLFPLQLHRLDTWACPRHSSSPFLIDEFECTCLMSQSSHYINRTEGALRLLWFTIEQLTRLPYHDYTNFAFGDLMNTLWCCYTIVDKTGWDIVIIITHAADNYLGTGTRNHAQSPHIRRAQ